MIIQTAYLTTLALLLLLMSGRFRAISQQLNSWLLIYVASITAVEFLALYFAEVKHQSNHPVHNFGMPVYITAFVIFYIKQLPTLRKFGLTFLVIYYLFAVINLVWGQGLGLFNTFSLMVGSIGIVVLTGRYFFSLLQLHDESPLLREPIFWISSGFFFFYLCNVFAAGTILYFLQTNNAFAILEIQIIQFLNISLLLCIAIGILCLKQAAKPSK